MVTPAPYNNLNQPPTTDRKWNGVVLRALRNPGDTPTYRVIILTAVAGLSSIAWSIAVLLLPSDVLQASLPLAGVFLAFGWALFAVIPFVGKPFMPRLVATGIAVIITWTALTGLLAFTSWLHPVAWGVGIIWLCYAALMLTPSWVVEFSKGEVYHYAPQMDRPCFLRYTEGGENHKWIIPLDELQLFWQQEDRIAVNQIFDELTSTEGYNFGVRVKLACAFEPERIEGKPLQDKLAELGNQAAVKEMLLTMLLNVIDNTARDFYINMAYEYAMAAGTVTVFKKRLPELLRGIEDGMGLSVLPLTVVCIPQASGEVKQAAERAAAAAYDATADLAVQKELLRQALEGSVPSQLVLYAQMVAQGRQFHYDPTGGQASNTTMIDQLMQAIYAGDREGATRLFQQINTGGPSIPHSEPPPQANPTGKRATGRRRSINLSDLNPQDDD